MKQLRETFAAFAKSGEFSYQDIRPLKKKLTTDLHRLLQKNSHKNCL